MNWLGMAKSVFTGGGIFSEIIGIGRDWLASKRRVTEQKAQAQIQYLQTEQGARHAWNIQSIQASGKGMRWASFSLWSAPFVWAFINPDGAAEAFQAAIAALPDWYVTGYLLVTAGVWGAKEIATLRNTTKARGAEDKILDKLTK